jgi:hypothetical protein
MDKKNYLELLSFYNSGMFDSWEGCIEFLLIFTEPICGEPSTGYPTHEEVLEAKRLGYEEYLKKRSDNEDFTINNNQNLKDNG